MYKLFLGLFLSLALVVNGQSVSASADKMNVLYIGVDNPVTIAASGLSSDEVFVTLSGGGGATIEGSGSKYIVRPTQQTYSGQFCNIDVFNTKTNQKIASFPFRVKRIPDPQAQIGGKTDGKITEGEMKVQGGVVAVLQNFDFDAKCEIISYTMVSTPFQAEPSAPITVNGAARFDGKVSALIQQAKPGTVYQFYDIKCRCPGDSAGRKLNGITLTIR